MTRTPQPLRTKAQLNRWLLVLLLLCAQFAAVVHSHELQAQQADDCTVCLQLHNLGGTPPASTELVAPPAATAEAQGFSAAPTPSLRFYSPQSPRAPPVFTLPH